MPPPKDPLRYQKWREHRSISMKGKLAGEKNLMYGKPRDEMTRKKISDTKRGKPGKIPSDITRLKMSLAQKGKRTGVANPRYGIHLSESLKKKISLALKGKRCGSNSHNWLGGVSFEPYCPKFNNEFKERVRVFFNYTCQMCGHIWQYGERKLSVHHVNFDKQTCCNDSIPLFIPICTGKCHNKTNHHRAFWEDWFTEIINEFYKGKCYLTKDEFSKLGSEHGN